MKTLIRLRLPDLGLQCLPRPVCQKTATTFAKINSGVFQKLLLVLERSVWLVHIPVLSLELEQKFSPFTF